MNKVVFNSKDGLKLVGVWHLPDKPTTKAVVLAHGLTVDKDENGIFIKLAELLKKNDLAVFRFDFRGHGESGGESREMMIRGELMDLSAAVDYVINKGYKKIGLLEPALEEALLSYIPQIIKINLSVFAFGIRL